MELTHSQLWEKCLSIIKDNISPEQYDAWFKPITSVSFDEGVLILEIPSQYFKEHIETRFGELLCKAINRV